MLNEILIIPTDRAYSVQFPYKPNANAIRGFHSLGMAWRNIGGNVVWSIPKEKLAESVDFIQYWFCQKAEPGRAAYGVRVVEAEIQLEEAA